MTEHVLRITRRNLGKGMQGGGSFFGTVGRCTCGWGTKVNTAPSRGGRKQVEGDHARHVNEQGDD